MEEGLGFTYGEAERWSGVEVDVKGREGDEEGREPG